MVQQINPGQNFFKASAQFSAARPRVRFGNAEGESPNAPRPANQNDTAPEDTVELSGKPAAASGTQDAGNTQDAASAEASAAQSEAADTMQDGATVEGGTKTERAEGPAAVGEEGSANEAEAAKAKPTRSNLKLAETMLFSSVIPLASCFLYSFGLLPGIVVGAPVAYLSGMYGRKLRKQMQENDIQAHQAMHALDNFAEKLKKGPENLQPGDFGELFNQVVGNMAELRANKWVGVGLAVLNNRFVRKFLDWTGIAKIGTALKNVPVVKWAMEHLNILKTFDKYGAKAVEHGVKGAVLKALMRGMSINMRVANESNPIKAAWEGFKGLVSFTLWPLILSMKIFQGIFGDDNKPSPKPEGSAQQQGPQAPPNPASAAA